MSAIATPMPSSRPRLWNLLVAVAALALSGLVAAEPPSRAARLGYISGTVGFSPAGSDDWVRAVMNRPLTNGDRLWVDANSRAEVQIGGAAIRLGAATSVTLLNLDDRIAQVQLSQGTLKVRVRRMGPNQAVEVDTPNLAFYVKRPGEYRIDVDPNDDATAVRVLSGRAEVYGERGSYSVNAQQGFRFYGTDLADYDRLATRRDDELDRWARDRERRYDNSRSASYVSLDVVGYDDLDANGTWRSDPQYGNVWAPTQVASGWTPYRDGHWAWIDPWGWTWVDDAPWGYAVSHYGRWANSRGSWVWVPGPRQQQAVYAPAVVGFVGGQNRQGLSGVGGVVAALVGWFPLAPREVYQPSYPVSRSYFDRINRSNAAIAPATVINVYNTTIVNKTTNVTQVVYANQRVQGAVVAVPAQAFADSQPVSKAAVQVSKETAVSAPVANVAAVAPVKQSVHGVGRDAGARPPAREHRVVARTAPPPAPITFAAQQKELASKPGMPIDDARRKELKPAAAAAPKVDVVAAPQAAAPTVAPPATPPAGKSPDARRADAARRDGGRADAAKGDADKADTAKADAAKGDAARRDAAKADAAKADAAKADAAKVEAAKADAARADSAKADVAKADVAKAAAAKAEASRADAAKADATKADAMKAEAAKGNAARRDAAKLEAAKADAARADAAKADAVKVDAAKADATKAAAKADAAKAAAKAEASRADAAKAEAARADAAKADAVKADAAKADATKTAAKADAAKADAAKAEAAKAAAKAEASRADAAKAEAARADAAKAEAAKVATEKADAARAAAAKADAAKAEAVRADAAKADAAKAAAAKAEAARADAAKAEATRAEAAKADAAKAEAAKADAAKAAAKAEASRAEAVKAEAARVEAAKAAAVKAEASRADAAKASAAKAESAKADAAKIATAKAEAAKAEAAKAEAGKAEAGKANKEKGSDARAAKANARALRTDAEKAEDEKKKAEEEGQKR